MKFTERRKVLIKRFLFSSSFSRFFLFPFIIFLVFLKEKLGDEHPM
jgi:hypothetical protein